jgi:endonuclease/exonuclease/phosphatase family metal-dependent hydrolase
MRIATWNLDRPCNYKQNCPSAILTEINAVAGVDVWVLTEVQNARTHLTGFVPVAYTHQSLVGKNWAAIWVREGLEAKPVTVCEHERTRATCVILPDTDVGPILIYGSVLWGGEGISYADSLANQKQDWQEIQALQPDASFCLAGDLDKSLADVPLSDRTNRGQLRDALNQSHLTCLTAQIYHSFDDTPEEQLPTIDHVCVSDRLTLASPAFLIPQDSRHCSFRTAMDSTAKKRVGSWYTERNERLSDHHGVAVTLSAKLGHH